MEKSSSSEELYQCSSTCDENMGREGRGGQYGDHHDLHSSPNKLLEERLRTGAYLPFMM